MLTIVILVSKDFPFLPTHQCIEKFLKQHFLRCEKNVMLMSLILLFLHGKTDLKKQSSLPTWKYFFLMCMLHLLVCSHLPAECLEDHRWKLRGLCSSDWWNFKYISCIILQDLMCWLGQYLSLWLSELWVYEVRQCPGSAPLHSLFCHQTSTLHSHHRVDLVLDWWLWFLAGIWKTSKCDRKRPNVSSWGLYRQALPSTGIRIVLGVSEKAKDLQTSWLTLFGGVGGGLRQN